MIKILNIFILINLKIQLIESATVSSIDMIYETNGTMHFYYCVEANAGDSGSCIFEQTNTSVSGRVNPAYGKFKNLRFLMNVDSSLLVTVINVYSFISDGVVGSVATLEKPIKVNCVDNPGASCTLMFLGYKADFTNGGSGDYLILKPFLQAGLTSLETVEVSLAQGSSLSKSMDIDGVKGDITNSISRINDSLISLNELNETSSVINSQVVTLNNTIANLKTDLSDKISQIDLTISILNYSLGNQIP